MSRSKPSVAVDRERYKQFVRNAQSFEAEAEDAVQAKRWNPAGALYMLAAIAWCDAMTVRFGGKKSTGDNHANAAALLSEIVPFDPNGKRAAVKAFRLLIQEKTQVSYSGDPYDSSDIDRLKNYFTEFSTWCAKGLKAKSADREA